MLNRLEISALPPGPRWPAQLRIRVDGVDVAAEAVGDGGRGPVAEEALHADRSSSLRATTEGRRVVLGEPECTGGCCGFLSVFVQRFGDIVQWSDWEIPSGGAAPAEFHFAADQYDAEVDRACADR